MITTIVTGNTNSTSKASVITATAAPRRSQSLDCNWRISGQVATTIMAAQMVAPMKGLSTQNAEMSRPPMHNTPSVMRGRSTRGRSAVTSGTGARE